ncbi:MAG: hypothetical protein NC203_03080 [Firmicutes bacterium]|nr:hypothetical protein [[Eubacterium] siraeum]MCM1487328.1 hypothetical protein [Bacillota bacterium]
MEKIEINYDNTLAEIEKGYTLFIKKYTLKRSIIFTIVYAIAMGAGIDFVIHDHTSMPGYLLTVIGLGMIISTWGKPVVARKKLLKTLASFGEEKYTAAFYDDRIEIDTEILPDEQLETVAVTPQGVMTVDQDTEIPPEQEIKHEKTKLALSGNSLDSMETEEMFLLFVNRSYIYIFPKRCLNDVQIKNVHDYFEEKNI